MSKYVKYAEQEEIFLKHVNKVGVVSYLCTQDGKWNFFELRLKNTVRRFWKTKDTETFISKLNLVESES